MSDIHDVLVELRRLKFWLILAVLLWAVTLGYTIGLSRQVERLDKNVLWQIDKTSQIKAAYEEQKKDLYRLNERFTEADVERRVGLILKEKQDE